MYGFALDQTALCWSDGTRSRIANASIDLAGIRFVAWLPRLVELDGAVDQLQFAVDVDMTQLLDHDHGQIAVRRDVARADLDLQALVRALTGIAHQGASFLTRHLDVSAIARQIL